MTTDFLAELKAKYPELARKVRRNEPLKEHVTLKVGGPAKYFCEVREVEELKVLMKAAFESDVPVFILGQGSNVIFLDEGFEGLVIKNLCHGDEDNKVHREDRSLIKSGMTEEKSGMTEEKSGMTKEKSGMTETNSVILEAESGAQISQLIIAAVEQNLSGLEWFTGLPGTIGGAVYGNAGRFGHEIGEVVDRVAVFDVITGEEKILTAEELKFGYRYSGLQKKGGADGKLAVGKSEMDEAGRFGSPVVLKVWLKLKPEEPAVLQKRQAEILAKMNDKYPTEPSAGSFFKNPENEREAVSGKISAGWLIEQTGLKGHQIGGAKISEKHANFIVNTGAATAGDILELADLVKKTVKEKFGVELEEEVRVV